MEKEICIKCNDEFQLEPNLDAIQKKYCPYCRKDIGKSGNRDLTKSEKYVNP